VLRLITKRRPRGIIILVAADLIIVYISIGAGLELVRDPSGKIIRSVAFAFPFLIPPLLFVISHLIMTLDSYIISLLKSVRFC
jgi:hypothetical protein